jgi:hypothetical protein
VHLGVDHQSGGVERVGEDAEQRQVPGPRFGLVGQEAQHGLRHPLAEGQLGIAGAKTPQVAAERIGQQVLARAVQAQVDSDVGQGHEHVEREAVHPLVLGAMGMGQDQRQIVATGGHLPVDQQRPLDTFDPLPGLVHHRRVDAGVADEPSGVGLDDAQRQHDVLLSDSVTLIVAEAGLHHWARGPDPGGRTALPRRDPRRLAHPGRFGPHRQWSTSLSGRRRPGPRASRLTRSASVTSPRACRSRRSPAGR